MLLSVLRGLMFLRLMGILVKSVICLVGLVLGGAILTVLLVINLLLHTIL